MREKSASVFLPTGLLPLEHEAARTTAIVGKWAASAKSKRVMIALRMG